MIAAANPDCAHVKRAQLLDGIWRFTAQSLWETQIAPSKTDIIKMTMKYLSARDLLISIGMSLSKGTSATRLIHKIEYWLEDDRQEKMTQYEEAVRRLKRLQ